MKEGMDVRFEKVMVIDDNLIDLYIATRMITKNNFGKKVLQYSSAIDALEYLQENRDNKSCWPDVIFVDINMPGMTGFEFMEEYDKLPASLKKFSRVFIISSSQHEEDIAKAKDDKNIIAMEEKPISKNFLSQILDQINILPSP